MTIIGTIIIWTLIMAVIVGWVFVVAWFVADLLDALSYTETKDD